MIYLAANSISDIVVCLPKDNLNVPWAKATGTCIAFNTSDIITTSSTYREIKRDDKIWLINWWHRHRCDRLIDGLGVRSIDR